MHTHCAEWTLRVARAVYEYDLTECHLNTGLIIILQHNSISQYLQLYNDNRVDNWSSLWEIPLDLEWKLYDLTWTACGMSLTIKRTDARVTHAHNTRSEWPCLQWSKVLRLHLTRHCYVKSYHPISNIGTVEMSCCKTTSQLLDVVKAATKATDCLPLLPSSPFDILRCWCCSTQSSQSSTWRTYAVVRYRIVSAALCTRGKHILEVVGNTYVRSTSTKSRLTTVLFSVPFGVPLWSVLGTILFLSYTADLLGEMTHGLQPHLYADEIPIYTASVVQVTLHMQLHSRVSICVGNVLWMHSNRLQLNTL